MHCPSCKSPSLKPIKLSVNLPARKCLNCRGVLIDLLSYRSWSEDSPKSAPGAPSATEVADNKRALVCPKCSRVMLKFKIGNTQANTIDVCGHCDEAWLDEGEWQLLEALALQDQLAAIFTEPWERRIRSEAVEASQRQRNMDTLGVEDFAEVERIAAWVAQHPKRSELIQFCAMKNANNAVKPFACGSLGRSALRTCSGMASPFFPEQALHAERRLPWR